MGHTPGPWKVCGFSGALTGAPEGRGFYGIVAGNSETPLCEICETFSWESGLGGNAKMKADACLISASPEGYEIALWALKVCKQLDTTDIAHIGMDENGNYLEDAIEKYLAKVKGEGLDRSHTGSMDVS